MGSERVVEDLLVQYLLGNLPEEEQVQVEDRAFADAEYLGALQSVEADLIDAYVRGQHSPADRHAFERRFLTSPQRRNKVEFAMALAQVSAESRNRESTESERPSAWQSIVGLFREWNPALQFAGGLAALISVVGLSWLIAQHMTMRSRVDLLEAQRRNLQSQEQTLRNQLSEQQSRLSNLTAELQKQQSSERTPLAIASLVLLPGLSRAGTSVEQLVLNPSTQILNIQVQLEPVDVYSRFHAELKTRKGEDVLFRSNLPRRRVGAGYAVSFDVPASALRTGDYELALKGVAAGGSAEPVGFYYFRVQQR